jgi:hypothetical protein
MKTFEQQYQAWLDDRLTPAEAEAFEKELESRELTQEQMAELERDLPPLREALREHAAPKPLRNQAFFNQRVQEEIAEHQRQEPREQHRPEAARRRSLPARFLSILKSPPLALVGSACALAVLAVIAIYQPVRTPAPAPVASGPRDPAAGNAANAQNTGSNLAAAAEADYYVQFQNVTARNENIYATPVKTGGAQVLWLDGLDWIDYNQDIM